MQLEVTVYDATGNVVKRDICAASTATDAEIADMVAMIESGTPAHLAAALAKQHPQPEPIK